MKNSTLLKKCIEKGLKIGYVDIETSPFLSWHYPTKKVFINHKQIKLGTKVTSVVIMDEKTKKKDEYSWVWTGPITIDYKSTSGGGDDSSLMDSVSTRLNQFDIVIGQNGDRFDLPSLQHRLYQLRLSPLKNIITLDTLKLSRKAFRAPSHSLDYQGSEIGSGKIHQDMEDAQLVAEGHPNKTKERLVYNIKDVTMMRDVFWSRLDYYTLPRNILNMFRSFVKEIRIYCIKCAARRQKRFEIQRVRKKGVPGGKWQCINCSYTWSIKPGEFETFKKNRGDLC